jgi:hypothetical protein
VFWSWQSGRPAKVTKNFVKQALEKALANVANDLQLAAAERPELDHDTKGEAGLVEIANTILAKIDASTAFVADVTPIAETEQGKKVPNPNVMIELGHALKVLGHKPIILVANTVYGGNNAMLQSQGKKPDGSVAQASVYMVKEDGTWKLAEELAKD